MLVQKAMLQDDANEQELRELKEQLSTVSRENRNLSSKVKIQKEQSEFSLSTGWDNICVFMEFIVIA